MATLWLHKHKGCDFIVSFDDKFSALEFATQAFDKAFAVIGEEADYSLDELSIGGVLVTGKDIPTVKSII